MSSDAEMTNARLGVVDSDRQLDKAPNFGSLNVDNAPTDRIGEDEHTVTLLPNARRTSLGMYKLSWGNVRAQVAWLFGWGEMVSPRRADLGSSGHQAASR